MPIPLNHTQLFTNNAVTLLASPIAANSTALTVMSGYGAQFPQPSAPNEFFLITLENQSASTREIIKVTGRTGDTFTFSLADRGQEGTTPQAWNASLGDDTLVDHRITAETMFRAMQLPIGGATAVALNDLTDVDLSTPPTIGQTIKFNGTQWVPANDTTFVPGSINAFMDVDTVSTPPVIGHVLTWNGTNWVPAADNDFVPASINAFTDVDTATTPPTVGQTLKWNGTNWVPAADNDTIFTPGSINAFTDVDTTGAAIGQVLQWNGTNWVPYTLPPAGTAWINGENTNGTNIDPGWQIPVSEAQYSNLNRTFKFIVTVTHTTSFVTRAFEVLLSINGNLSSNAETVAATQYAFLGPSLAGDLHATLNTSTKTLRLEWENLEAVAVTTSAVRIQHLPV